MQRTIRIYQPNNSTVIQAAEAILPSLGVLFEDGSDVEIRFWRDCIFVNGDRVRCDVSNFSAYKHLLGRTAELRVEKLIVSRKVKADDIIAFMKLLATAEDEGLEGEDLARMMEEARIRELSIVPASEVEDLEDLGVKTLTNKERARRAFHSALGSVKEILLSQSPQGSTSLRKAKRAVQSAADSLLDDESSILALAAIKDHDDYTFTHSVNVCVFSLAIGQRLGLHKSWLARLGIAALFHDIGKIAVPTAVLNKIGVLETDEWRALRRHTVIGVRKLSRISRCDEQVLHALIVAYQHHLNLDLSGYPEVPEDTSIDLFSRIVRIADTFDAMTTQRPYRNKVYSPHDAIRHLVTEAGAKYDPTLVKAFAGAMGIYPIGTVLRLNTGAVGMVVRKSELTSDLDRPTVRLLLDRAGNPPEDEELIDLGTIDPASGEFIYSVVDTLSCQDMGVNPRDYLL
jgi:HD-GYP domain-containing protein (c-di-GMP phosphodiesterase class II)